MKLADPIEGVLRYKGRQVWSVSPDATVFEALRIMSERDVGALLVLDEDDALAGIISERDYARKVILMDRSSKTTFVRDVMDSPALSVTPEDTVEECMRWMSQFRVRHLPVLHQGRVAGIVSIGDLVNWTISSHEQTIEHLQAYIEGKYPG
jgi:CBS domain-containing protein